MSEPPSAPSSPAPPVPRVMLLSLWPTTDFGWHARLVDADATVRDFDSPFELARFLSSCVGRPSSGPAGGLR